MSPLESALARREGWPVCSNALAAITRTETAHSGDIDATFRIASVTKLMTAWAVHIAAEEGIVAIDQPLDAVGGPDSASLGHLLAHASGLPFEGPAPVARPGTKRIYSNAGYDLAARLVAERAEMPFAAYLREAVFEPLGMTASMLAGSPARDVYSTVRDLTSFARELMHPTLVSRESWRLFATNSFGDLDGVVPGIGAQSPCPWGMGAEIRGLKHPHWTGHRNSAATYGHFGATGSFLWIDPVAEVACAGLSSLEFGDWALAAWPDLADAVLDAARQ